MCGGRKRTDEEEEGGEMRNRHGPLPSAYLPRMSALAC